MAQAVLSETGRSTPKRRQKFAWAFYDWADSAVVTLVIAAVFPVFYNSIAETQLKDQAASAFSFTISIGLLLSALAAPVIGTLADILGARKRLLIVTTILGGLATVAMFTIQDGGWVWASVLFVTVQVFLNISLGLYDSLLSHVAPENERDRLSALGYGLGYIGGGLQLAISVVLITAWKGLGLPDQATATRISLAMAGLWWIVFAVPLILNVAEPPATPPEGGITGSPMIASFRRLAQTFRQMRRYSELLKMLAAFLIYSEGIGTIIQLATTYGRQQIGLSQDTLIGALLLTQFVAFPFAIMFGRLPETLSKNRDFFAAFILWTTATFPLMGAFAASASQAMITRSIEAGGPVSTGLGVTTIFGLIAANQVIGVVFSLVVGRRMVATFANRMTTKLAILFGLGVYVVIAIWGFFLYTAAEFWMLAFLVGTVQGGTQALSRSLYSQLSPRSKSGEFFGFYGFSDKFAGILGPLLFGIIGLSGNLRPAILSVVVFFVLGGLLLTRVNVAVGMAHAAEEDQETASPRPPSP